MGKLTIELIAKASSNARKKRDESLNHYLKRLTHLYFAEKKIDGIDDLSQCRNLSVLYLYDNNISKITNLGFASNLTHLYLQNNAIQKIENLGTLTKLSKLYLGGNYITVLEGLDKLDQLRELHIENQQLPPGERLLFDPRSLATLSICLQVLNVSGNNLDEVNELRCLQHLAQFMANDNILRDFKALANVIGSWRNLWRLELSGNPLSARAKYRDRIIVLNENLAVLDGKEISSTEKKFLVKWKEAKDTKKRMRREGSSIVGSANTLTQNGHSGRDLPPLLGAPSRTNQGGLNQVYVMPGMVSHKKEFEAVLAKSASLPNSAAKIRQPPAPPLTLTRKSHSDLEYRPRRVIMQPSHRTIPDESRISLTLGEITLPSFISTQIEP